MIFSRVDGLILYSCRLDENENSGKVAADTVSVYETANKLGLRNIAHLLRIICVLPITSNEAERSFSKLKLVKSERRTTMSNERYVLFLLL